ncbi:hypothetical protein JX266_007618 [Neoarthrinium moseri]|nr:hypothetical protein JX266_007618 [Neoarthrinium moseri]
MALASHTGRAQFIASSDRLQGFQAISSVAKRLDPNKVEVAFASRPTKAFRARRTKNLVEMLERHEFQHDPHLMQKSLSELIEHQIIRKLPVKKMGFNINPISRKHVSIYIFTDGNWGDDPKRACLVEKPVESLIHEVKHRKLSPQQVTMHFVRFGDSAEGFRHLQYLDCFGEREDIDFDIVDVKHISSNVVSLFYGPLSHHSDREGEEFY